MLATSPFKFITIEDKRVYDENGKAYRDIDYTNHGNAKNHPQVPHEHTWEWQNGTPKRIP